MEEGSRSEPLRSRAMGLLKLETTLPYALFANRSAGYLSHNVFQ